MRRGSLLIETLVAIALLLFACILMGKSFAYLSDTVHFYSQLMAAESLAMDVGWNRFNQSWEDLVRLNYSAAAPYIVNVTSNECPALYREDEPPKVYTVITNRPVQEGICIAVNVTWTDNKGRRWIFGRNDGNQQHEADALDAGQDEVRFYRCLGVERGWK